MSEWSIVFSEWDPDEQPRREALCALGNGYLVTRAADETRRADGLHYPGTYLAGGYDRRVSRIAGERIENEDLVNWPDWTHMAWRPEQGRWFRIEDVQILEFEQSLDLKRGVLERRLRTRDEEGRTTRLTSRRLVSMDDPHLCALEWELTPEDWSGGMEIRSEIDGRVRNGNVARYSDLESHHVETLEARRLDEERVLLVCRSIQSRLRVAMAARLRAPGADPRERLYTEAGDRAGQRLVFDAREGEPIALEKVVSVFSGRDHAISEPGEAAAKDVARAPAFERLLTRHERAWGRLWERFDLSIGRDPEQALLRLHTFHLLQTVSPNTIDRDVGVPARGWHGEAYRGHVLWDELFIFPLLNLQMPDLTRALLMYRYRRLDEARAYASSEGRIGARYPWQSGSDGREESQFIHLNPQSGRWIPDNSSLQRHINLAIAFNVWQYFEATGDCDFFCSYGVEMLVEICRYMADLAEEGDDGRFHVRGVMGPDEFHEKHPGAEQPGIDDNAYTNVLTSWALASLPRALEVIGERNRARLERDLSITEEELERLDEISRSLYVPFHDDGIISQYEGFDDLEEIDWEKYRNSYDDVQRMDRLLEAEGESPATYKVAKQADVLMLFFLFSAEHLRSLLERMGYDFPGELIPKNVQYYLERTSHGSTLSRIVHAWVLARSDRQESWALFREALRSDIDDIQGGTTKEGIHLGAMAGTVDLVNRCYTGVEIREGMLRLNPLLPREIQELRLSVIYRGAKIRIAVMRDEMELTLVEPAAAPMKVVLREEIVELPPGRTQRLSLKRSDEGVGSGRG